jgi:hypothetical protein
VPGGTEKRDRPDEDQQLDVVAVLVIFLVGLTVAPLPVLSLVVVPVMITVWQGILS